MRRRVLLCLALMLVSACQGDDATRPKLDPASSPSPLISDGSHSGGNPDFFFLPPLVRDPKTLPGGAPNPMWNAGASNVDLTPTVRICELNVGAVSSKGVPAIPVTAATACKAGSPPPTTLTAANVSRGILDDVDIDNALTRFLTHYSSFVEPYYHFGWKVPAGPTGTTRPPAFYRIDVRVGTRQLGILDVEAVNNFTQLLNVKTNEFVPLTGSLRVPINFRIENLALCETPGDPTKPCASKTVDLSDGGTVSAELVPGSNEESGIVIPPQSPDAPPVVFTVQNCDNLNPRAIDLPTFGPCIRVTADDGTSASATRFAFTNAATVFTCDVDAAVHAAITAGRLTAAQEPLVTLHRLDDFGTPSQRVAALQHVPACGKGLGSRDAGTLKGMLASLAHGQLTRAARQAASLLTPKPLYASMFIDLGGGGFTFDLSDFQFALPAKMSVVEGTSGRIAPVGAVLDPTVKVTDLHGDPVFGATVQFASGARVTTGSLGTASAPWTIPLGTTTLSVTGRGIANEGNDGPRTVFDPFQPIHSPFDPGVLDGGEVAVGSGTVTFSATGIQSGLTDGFESGGDLGSATGFWHRSTLATPDLTPLSNVAYPSLVVAAPGDLAPGRLPKPAGGAHALWFGSDDHGNYAGPLLNADGGGTTAAARSGVATSPEFFVPESGNVMLTFQSWFEIESVNPSAFDLMQVYVREVGQETAHLLTTLNPGHEEDGGPATWPFTANGRNAPPVWTLVTAGLNDFRGKRVVLLFSFDTGDTFYNAFRGWVVDDVTVRTVAGLAGSSFAVPLRASTTAARLSNAPPPAPRTWHP
jgi:hypothetical protein